MGGVNVFAFAKVSNPPWVRRLCAHCHPAIGIAVSNVACGGKRVCILSADILTAYVCNCKTRANNGVIRVAIANWQYDCCIKRVRCSPLDGELNSYRDPVPASTHLILLNI